ncbi:MAG: cupin domain-containing protein [Arenicella sp.]
MKNKYLIAVLSLTVAAAAYAGNATKAPEKSHGLSPEVAHQNSLEAQIPSMKGYDIRGRKITLLPGAATAEHSHAERPGIVYVMQGSVVEYRNGEKRKFTMGDTWIETADTVHWVKNPMKEPAVIFMVDLPKQK